MEAKAKTSRLNLDPVYIWVHWLFPAASGVNWDNKALNHFLLCVETNQSKGEHSSAALLSLSPRPQTALFLIVRVKESEVALSGAGATYRAPIICLDKVLGGTKAAWWW